MTTNREKAGWLFAAGVLGALAAGVSSGRPECPAGPAAVGGGGRGWGGGTGERAATGESACDVAGRISVSIAFECEHALQVCACVCSAVNKKADLWKRGAGTQTGARPGGVSMQAFEWRLVHHPERMDSGSEPGGSACCYWNGCGTQCSHPAQ